MQSVSEVSSIPKLLSHLFRIWVFVDAGFCEKCECSCFPFAEYYVLTYSVSYGSDCSETLVPEEVGASTECAQLVVGVFNALRNDGF